MPKLKGVAIGDLHLSKPRLKSLFGDRATPLILQGVRRVLTWAIEQKLNHAFLLGDLCDQATFLDEDELALQQLLFEFDGRIQVHIILGNHDVEQKTVNSMAQLQDLADRKVFKTIHIYSDYAAKLIDGVMVEFLPFPYTDPKHKNSVCLAHFERPGSMRDNGTTDPHGVPEPAGTNLWLIGHLHTPQSSGRSYYPGTLDQKYFGEKPDKRYITFEAWTEGKALAHKVKWHDHEPEFKLLTLDLAEMKQWSDSDIHRYRITNYGNQDVPEGFLVKHPNVVELIPHKKAKTEADLIALETTTVSFKMLPFLVNFLEGRGHDKDEIRRGKRMWRRLRAGKPIYEEAE